ncbi:MAG: Xaa-Pro peptidase family protein, partial [Phycisphaerales bacterium]
MPIESIPLNEYATRRTKLLTSLKRAAALVFAGSHTNPLTDEYRPHPHFEYLTGIVAEPNAVLLLDPTNAIEARRAMLFLAPLNPEVDKWDGYRLEINKALRDKIGFKTIFRTDALGRWLTAAVKRSKRVACLHPFADYNHTVTPDLEVFRKVTQRIPGVTIDDHTETIAKMRAVKSKNEVAMIQRAIDITAAGYDAMFKGVRPGMNEFAVQELLEHGYRSHGSRGPAYGTIAGAGLNSTVLHYRANDQTIAKNDLICIDSAARFGGYGADITRTVPASGKFNKRQREVYEIVLKAELAAIRAVKPGVTFARVDNAARDIITKAGYGDYFIHGIGHHLG